MKDNVIERGQLSRNAVYRDGRINSYPIESIYPHDACAILRHMAGERKMPGMHHIPAERRLMLVRRVQSLVHHAVAKMHERAGLRIMREDMRDRRGYSDTTLDTIFGGLGE